jgi:PAS domain S-box-containing protein
MEPQRQSDIELLIDISRILSAKLDTDELIQTIMDFACRVVKSEAASLLLLDEKTNELYFTVALGEKGDQVKEIRLKVGEGIAGWVAKEKKPLIVNDVTLDKRWTEKADEKTRFKTRAILAVPLMSKGKLLGVVEAINQMNNADFNERDQRLLEAFASHAAIAIENARLFRTLREEKDKLELVFSEMSDGALLFDEIGKTVLYNNGACRLLGLGDIDYAKKLVSELLQGFDVQPSIEVLVKKLDKIFPVEISRSIGKPLILQGMVNRLSSEDGELIGFLAVFRDVTLEKREEKLKRNFLSLISHKLKTPLVTIAGYVPLLLEDAPNLNDFQLKALKSMKIQTTKLTTLVEKLLNFTLLESEAINLNLQSIPLHIPISETIMHLKTYIQEKKAVIERDESIKTVPSVNIDPEFIREVLRNLMENAIKFNMKEEKKVILTARHHEGYVFLDITDNGPGIPSEEQNKIFSKFYQVEESFTGQVEGAGLGLALCKIIMESHNGSLAVRSTLGQGTTFTLKLPAAVLS